MFLQYKRNLRELDQVLQNFLKTSFISHNENCKSKSNQVSLHVKNMGMMFFFLEPSLLGHHTDRNFCMYKLNVKLIRLLGSSSLHVNIPFCPQRSLCKGVRLPTQFSLISYQLKYFLRSYLFHGNCKSGERDFH